SIVDYLHGDAAGRERASLQRFVVSLSRLFGRHYPGCVQGWADAAVQWAMSCPVRPLAGLALQVFGVLAAEAQYGGPVVITPTRQIVLRLVDRLSNVIGDPSPELGAFAETVLAGIRQTAGLAARMCAEDEDINSDLLATGLVLMRTTQSAGVYSMALGVFERVIQLADADETRFRECVTERVGWLCADGYQAALLRGLEFAACRDRSLSLLRETLKYDMAPEAVVSGCRAHPMLTLASQIPALIEEAVQDAAAVQRAFLQSTRAADGNTGGSREPDVADSTADASEGDDGAAQECLADSLASVASSSSTNNNEEKNGIDERCAAFIEQCAQGLVLATSGGMKDVRLLVKRLQALLVPPADAMAAQRVSEVARESVELFGYAVVECGPDIAGQVVVLLLQLLHPTGRARLALRYLRDEQMARTVGEQAHATGAAEMAVGYASELRRIYVCLQLIHSVLAAGDTGGGRAAGLRMDAAMAPSLRHLFDLLIVARPISDLASRVLNTLLQRFNDALPTPAARGLAPLSQCGMAAHGFQWYESNAVTLVEAARAALAEIVAMGFDAEEAAVACASNDSRGDSTDASLHGGTLAMALGCASATPRSASPEMPVLVIPDASEDEVRVERLCGYDGDHGAIGFAEQRVAEEDHDEIGEECDQSDKDTHDIMAELDDFDRELDAALDS
ncbi:Cell morphogenesis protein PAG1, partial [Coemansia biformis]